MKRKEAIEVIKKNYPDSNFTMLRDALETLIPELKESEDEKILRHLKAVVKAYDMWTERGLSMNDVLTWLEKQGEHAKFLSKIQVGDKVTLNEDGVLVNLTQLNRVVNKGIENAIKAKQGEQKPKVNLHVKCIANKVEPFKYEGLTDFERTLADICIGWIGEEPGWKQYIKDNADVLLKIAAKNFNSVQDAASEQKPAWSEEDETSLRKTEYAVMKFFGGDCSLVGWLRKSLRDQNTWKPSDQQMASITCAVRQMKESPCYDSELVSLYNDLKKLKG